MQFDVPAGNTLVFTSPDGSLLASPTTQPSVRTVTSVVPTPEAAA